ncbi:MFS transporter [Saccharopolyspora cebuensis]|uniref:MFS transporter n=1 Tax=Saccharopolyspora cebuensis TaxID=418759 RepID=A0ABV4CED3_9PSEU
MIVLHPYRLLLGVPHAPALMAASLLGRLHTPAVALVLTFLIVDWTGSYTTGGLVAGVLTVGQGIAGPLRGRAADRSSAPRLLLVTGVLWAVGMLVVVLLATRLDPALWWVVLPVALLTGLSHPPVTQVGRAIWPRLSGGAAREAAFAVEATLQELLFIIAPMAAAFLVAFWGSAPAALVLAGCSVVGPALFAAALLRAGLRAPLAGAGPVAGSAALFRVPGFAPMMLFAVLVVGGLITVDLVLVGWARERGTPELAGLLAGVWALGSLLGGLLVGGLRGPSRLGRRAALAAAGLVAIAPVLPPVADPASPWLVAAVLLVGGTAIAPTLAAVNGRLAGLVPQARHNEAFGWYASATMLGGAVASPLAGWALDGAGPAAAAALGGGLAVLGAVCVLHRALRGEPDATREAVLP